MALQTALQEAARTHSSGHLRALSTLARAIQVLGGPGIGAPEAQEDFRGLRLLSSFLAKAAWRVLSCSSWTCVDFVLLLSAGASCIRSPMMLSLQFFFSSLFVWGAPDERAGPGLEVSPPLVFFRRALQREAGKPRARAGSARYCYYSASHFPLLKLPVS